MARSSIPVGNSNALTINLVVNTGGKVALITTALHGTVTGAGDYTSGSTATLTATAAPGYAFTSWSGDASGTVNPVNLVMANPKSVTAIFSPDTSDEDADGLSAYLEAVVYHSNPALKDSDGDGFEDFYEVNTGFDPALATSTPDALSSIRTAVEFRKSGGHGHSAQDIHWYTDDH